jgi:hypothetical protein
MLIDMVATLAKFVRVLTPKRPWFQFSIRSLFVLVAIAAVPCVWMAWKMEHKRNERAAVAALRGLGATVYYDWEVEEIDPPGPARNCALKERRSPTAVWRI